MPTTDTRPGDDGRGDGRLLVAVLALAALLRVWSLDFGLPHSLARPDETEIVWRSVRFFATDLNPHFFHYPSLFFYLIGAVYAVGMGILALAGQPLTESLAAAALDLSPWILTARAISAAAGVATIAVIYRLGRSFGGPRVGLAAAVFLAVAPLHVRDSHFATTDVILTLFVTLATVYVLRSWRTGTRRDYALAGVCAGLAMSAKYVGLLLPAAIAVAWLLSLDTTRLSTPMARARFLVRDPRLQLFALCMLAAFFLTTPYALFDELFVRHFLFQFGHLGEGHGMDLGIGGVYHLRRSLPLGVGWPVYVLAFVGVGFALRDRWREALVLLAFPLVFYASTFTSQTVFLRYMMPVIPFLCLFAGFGAVRLVELVPAPRRSAALVGLLALFAAEPLVRDVSMNRLLGRTDSRVLAAEWLLDSVEPGTHTVYQTGVLWGHLELPRPAEFHGGIAEVMRIRAITPIRQRLRDYARFEAEVREDAAAGRPAAFTYVDSIGMRQGAEPDFIVLLESDLPRYSGVLPEARALLESGYEPVHRVAGASPGAGGWYDQLDAFYLPFVGFGDVTRPGPDVTIFRRRSPGESGGVAAEPEGTGSAAEGPAGARP